MGVSFQAAESGTLNRFGPRRPRLGNARPVTGSPPPSLLRDLISAARRRAGSLAIVDFYIRSLTLNLCANRQNGCSLRGPPSLCDHHGRASHPLVPLRALTNRIPQMFGVTGAGLYVVKRFANEGKKPRWNRDLWDRVSDSFQFIGCGRELVVAEECIG